MADHLWPARAEYLRVHESRVWLTWEWDDGDRTQTSEGWGWVVALDAEHGTCDVYVQDHGTVHDVMIEDVRIDLDSMTARARAAVVYTEARRGLIDADVQPTTDAHNAADRIFDEQGPCDEHAEALRALEILCGMRALDESVTIAEARSALAHAEGMRDGQ